MDFVMAFYLTGKNKTSLVFFVDNLQIMSLVLKNNEKTG